MITSVAKVTEEHLILVLRVGAGNALLAVGTLPVVAGHEAQQLQAEPHAGRVGGLVTLGAVQQQLRHSDLVLGDVPITMFTSGQGTDLIYSPYLLHFWLDLLLDGFLLGPGSLLLSP